MSIYGLHRRWCACLKTLGALSLNTNDVMKKELFCLKTQPDPFRVESTEPLIIWTICLGTDVLVMPELNFLIIQYYFTN